MQLVVEAGSGTAALGCQVIVPVHPDTCESARVAPPLCVVHHSPYRPVCFNPREPVANVLLQATWREQGAELEALFVLGVEQEEVARSCEK